MVAALLKKNISLIAGLHDSIMSVAVIDEHAIMLEVSRFCCCGKTAKILL
ncbi:MULTISPECIES: hypothetical protein [unclassified Bartonella]